MTSHSVFASLVHRFRFVCLALALCGPPAWAADHAALVNQAREELQNDRFIEALATAKDAVRANGNDYKGHYYTGLAYLGLGRFDEADDAAARAMRLAPESARPGVEKLVDAIKARRQSSGNVAAADAALAEGLLGKAARLYEEAWVAGKNNHSLAIKAADIYARRLDQPVDAARVLRQVVAADPQSDAARRARSELSSMSTKLREAAQVHVDASYGARCDRAIASLQKAEDADPSLLDIYKLRIQCVFGIDEIQRALKDLVKHNMAEPELLAQANDMQQLLKDPQTAQALADVLGNAKVEQLNRLFRERRAKYEKELAQYKADLASYDQRVRAREAEKVEKQASCQRCEGNCRKNHGGFWGNAVKEQKCYTWCYDFGWCGQEVKDVPKPQAPVEPK